MDRPASKSNRPRWTETRRVKEANLYDEWLKDEKKGAQQQPPQQPQQQPPLPPPPPPLPEQTPGRRSLSLHRGGAAAAAAALDRRGAATIRAVTPDNVTDASASQDSSPSMTERSAKSFERPGPRAFGTTTTIVGGPSAASAAAASSKSRRLRKGSDKEREARIGLPSSPRGSRDGAPLPSGGSGSGSGGDLARSNSKSNGQPHAGEAATVTAAAAAPSTARPRTRTMEEARWRDRSPTALLKSRNRIGSVHSSSSSPMHPSAEYAALGPVVAASSPPGAPSLSSFGSPVQPPSEMVGRRSISPVSSDAASSFRSPLPPANARRVVHLMRTLDGRMGGNAMFRRGHASPWSQSYCYVKDDSGSLMYEPRGGGEGAHRTLIADLRGCSVIPNVEDDAHYLEVNLPDSEAEVHVKVQTQSEFDSWFATFLWWQSSRPPHSNGRRPSSSRSTHDVVPGSPPPELPARRASAQQPDRASSSKSDRYKSSESSSSKEAPAIKIGKMIFWDMSASYYSSAAGSQGVHPAAGRPPANRMQSYGARRWRRISAQLRENGELKLHSDADNSLISVVQLSQLSRCAIQRLHPSVLNNDFSIGIYPQYTSNFNSDQPGHLRPIFLSLETRILYEVWFVLLRAFTMPQLYGPPRQPSGASADGLESENLSTTTTTTNDMFRVERGLSVRVVEAKMHSLAAEPSLSGAKPERHGYYAEVLLDNETRGKTAVKHEGLNPLWGESFDFVDLPPVLSSASVVIKRRPPDAANGPEQQEIRLGHDHFTSNPCSGFTGVSLDVPCGKVEIYLQELEEEKEVEKWWPVVNMNNQRVGELFLKARAEEGVVLMAHDYQPLAELLHRFSNGLTLQISQIVPSELKRVSDCLLNIFQVSGKAADWINALIEEEVDGTQRDTPISRLRYSRRIGSNDNQDAQGIISQHSDRELILRDLNKNATLQANLLFRGNTLLTKSLDTHMRRVGREYLGHSLAAKVCEINEKDPDCEVDPNRVNSPQDLEKNWRRLLLYTQDVWKAIVAAKGQCPVELRSIFRHIRACADDRYGDFLRTVSYSSVSGFLFLRFFCPAVLNPKLFGLIKDDIKPRARRTFTLIAKSLQTLSNMASFGTKEQWMEPMNAFLTQHREGFKSFIEDICYVPTPLSSSVHAHSTSSSAAYLPGVVSAETHLSYTTPNTIMRRLPPTSREGFPSLPYLIDQARAFADLVQLWMEITSPQPQSDDTSSASSKKHADIINAIHASDGDMVAFHETCTRLHQRTQECLSRAERAERPASNLSFHWEELIDQLQSNRTSMHHHDEPPTESSFDPGDSSMLPPGMDSAASPEGQSYEWGTVADEGARTSRDSARGAPPSQPVDARSSRNRHSARDRPLSANLSSSIQGGLRRALQSRGSDNSASANASASNLSSAVSSDTEHAGGTTALPSYEREVRHRERREAARQQIQQQVEEAKVREREKEKRRVKTPLAALRKKKEKDGRSENASIWKGVDMSHV